MAEAKLYLSSRTHYWAQCIGRTNVFVQLQLTSLVLLEKISEMDDFSFQQRFNCIPLPEYRCIGSFPFDYPRNLDSDNSAIINWQTSIVQGEHWIMVEDCRHNLYFADSLGQPCFPKQQYKQIMQRQLQPHPNVFSFYTIYAAFHLFRFQQEECLEFTMSTFFHIHVPTCNISKPSMWICRL